MDTTRKKKPRGARKGWDKNMMQYAVTVTNWTVKAKDRHCSGGVVKAVLNDEFSCTSHDMPIPRLVVSDVNLGD